VSEIMFENRTDIQPFLEGTELGLFAAEVERLCRPSICFEAGEDRTGGSRFGGLPDLAPGLAWPVREAYAHGASLAERLAERGEGFASQFAVAAPLDFVCQIDLTDALLHKSLGPLLPDEGRLLFFWDGGCGPWIEMAQSAQVIWDRSATASLRRRERPDALMQYLARDQRSGFKRATPAQPLATWSVPDRFLLKEIAESEALREAAVSDDSDDFWGDIMDMGLEVLTSGREVLPHRLGGWPIPEQWDPRHAAVASANGFLRLFDRMPTEEENIICGREMSSWTMLLQVDMASLGTDFGEGTVFFVMREADLAKRDFSRVHAIYQQT
jgi:uncharacterized protein YwqG